MLHAFERKERVAKAQAAWTDVLKLAPSAAAAEPTDDVPQVADRAKNFKIPTGRMNYGDRQRLRTEMERLPVRREENIEKLEEEFKEAFI